MLNIERNREIKAAVICVVMVIIAVRYDVGFLYKLFYYYLKLFSV